MNGAFLASLLSMGKNLATVLVPGAAAIVERAPAIVKAAKDAADTLRHAAAVAGAKDAAELEAVAGDLETRVERVLEELDTTIEALEGKAAG